MSWSRSGTRSREMITVQYKKLIVVFLAMIIVGAVLPVFWQEDRDRAASPIVFSPELSLKQLAEGNNLPVKEILHIAGHGDPSIWQVPRNRPIKLVIKDPPKIKSAIEYIMNESRPSADLAKYVLWALYLSVILLFIYNSRPIGRLRAGLLLLAVFVFGIILGAAPNPMEIMVKTFKYFNNMTGSPFLLAGSLVVFTVFSMIGTKFFCTWGCPLGALQESLYNVPVFKTKYLFKVPFALSLICRSAIFIVFLVLLFGLGYGVVYGIRDFVIYHHLNYFKIYDIQNIAALALYTLPLLVVLSLLTFRPFCHYICPFGLYSWIVENIAINRIKIDRQKCIKCGKCTAACPTEAMAYIYGQKRGWSRPDCWSCGKCIDACPVDAVKYD